MDGLKTCADLDLPFLWLGPGLYLKPRFKRLIFREWVKMHGPRCLFCNSWLVWKGAGGADRPNSASLDHIDARALGGTDAPDNLQVICCRCNNEKSALEFQVVEMERAA